MQKRSRRWVDVPNLVDFSVVMQSNGGQEKGEGCERLQAAAGTHSRLLMWASTWRWTRRRAVNEDHVTPFSVTIFAGLRPECSGLNSRSYYLLALDAAYRA